jgi:hypothetical protein
MPENVPARLPPSQGPPSIGRRLDPAGDKLLARRPSPYRFRIRKGPRSKAYFSVGSKFPTL